MTKYQANETTNKVTQLRKGILELAILSALYHQPHYGYSLVRQLTLAGASDLKEGTIYPILARLAKEDLVRTEWRESSQGPPRKYYELTTAGRQTCEALTVDFRSLVRLVELAGTPLPAGPVPESNKTIIMRSENHE